MSFTAHVMDARPAPPSRPEPRERPIDRLLKPLRGPSWAVLTRLFIGFGWLRAVGEKVIDPDWWSGQVIADFVDANAPATLGWYQPFVDAVVEPWAVVVALVVVIAQLAAGLALVTGRRLGLGLGIGVFLNLHFVAAGAVTPSVFYLLAQGALALWLAERGARRRRLEVAAAASVFVAGLSVPAISTLHPAHVIDDPAVMFAFGGSLAALSCLLAAAARPTV